MLSIGKPADTLVHTDVLGHQVTLFRLLFKAN